MILVLAAFGLIVLIATALLSLPVSSSGHGAEVTLLDALFTAISASCVTGLVVIETQTHWSHFGEAIILVLIQVGGFVYMAAIGLFLQVLGRRLGVTDPSLISRYYGTLSRGETFTYLKRLAIYVLLFEMLGALALFGGFVSAGVPAARSVWWAVFHSVSAFNVAGFNLTGEDMRPFADDPAVLIPMVVLCLAGALAALPVINLVLPRGLNRLAEKDWTLRAKVWKTVLAVWDRLRRKPLPSEVPFDTFKTKDSLKEGAAFTRRLLLRDPEALSQLVEKARAAWSATLVGMCPDLQSTKLEAKVVLTAAAVLIAGSALFIGISEWANTGTLATVDERDRPLLAVFQASMWVSGFSAIENGLLHEHTKLFESALMLVGGAAGSASGGVKLGTLAVLVLGALAALRGREDLVVFHRRLPRSVVREAAAVAVAFAFVHFVVAMLLLRTTDHAFTDVLYETSSAVGTVGWSAGITSTLGVGATVVVMAAILVGRFLPLLLIFGIAARGARPLGAQLQDSVRMG